MLPSATEQITDRLGPDALVLDVGGWAAPFNRADWVLDLMPYETRGVLMPGGHGPGAERFSAQTWVQRDICDREPWPFADDQFDFALCVTTLEDVRDPVWVCSELGRVAKAGYVEVPSLWEELAYGIEGAHLGHSHHRWICSVVDGGLAFTHKPHSIHGDWRLRVLPRWRAEMSVEDHLQGLFWEGGLPARERIEVWGPPVEEWRAAVRERFRPSRTEVALKDARDHARHVLGRARGAVERLLTRRH